MSVAPMALMAIGSAVSAVGTVVGMNAQMQAADYQAAVAAENERRANENAKRELERSQIEQMDYAQDARSQIGALMATLAASGFDATTGTPALQQRGTRDLAQRDAERIREEGAENARRSREQAADFRAERGMARRRRGFALTQGLVGLGQTFVGHATQVNRARGLIT